MVILPKHLITSLLLINGSLVWIPSTVAMSGDFVIPHIRREVYSHPGDINIGCGLDIHEDAGKSGCVGDIHPGSWAIQFPEALAFAVDMVNKNQKLMPKARLGFYLLDDCANKRYALANALTFLPRNELVCTPNPCNVTDSSTVACIQTKCSIKPLYKVPSLSSAYTEQSVPYYDVIGIISPQYSSLTRVMSFMLSVAKMPIIGYMTTTEELSDNAVHPSFLRVVASDKYQAHAMIEFIFSQGWSYISVVYSDGAYGENAFAVIKSLIGCHNVCIATTHRVKENDDMVPVAIDLLHHPRARVVIIFTVSHTALNLFEAIDNLNGTGRFIWLCSDAVESASWRILSQYMSNVVGAFMFTYNTVHVPEFYEYIRRQNVMTSLNPWFKLAWEDTFKCSFMSGTCNASADITRSANFHSEDRTSLLIDAVLTFAHGIHNLMADLCPTATGKAARDCIKRDTLLEYLFNVSFQGYTGLIEFDKNQDFFGKYVIYQMAYDNLAVQTETGKLKTNGLVSRKVAYFDSLTEDLTYTNENISWDHLIEVERIVPLNFSDLEVPESVCSKPCEPDEYKIQKEPVCCWECRKCRRNERLIDGNTGCEKCKKFTWPDPDTGFTTCRDIPLSYIIFTETVPVVEICLAVMGIIGTLLIAAAYVYHRATRVIKAASRELSAFQLGGILVGYATVILFQTTPTPMICTTLYFMFCLSFSWLYSPLLVKAVRIYRIFRSGRKGRRPRCISPMFQVIMASMIIILQVVLCLVVYILYNPTAVKSQPVPTEMFVELSCDMTLPGLVSFLVYNLVFVCLSAVFAFKTRHLPSNFNESKFISMCVYTTLVIWMAFIPTYFTATREFVQVLLLSASLLLNHTVALIFLFVPKIYAIMYVDDADFITDKTHTTRTGMDSSFRQPSIPAQPEDVPVDELIRLSGVWMGKEQGVSAKNVGDVKASKSMNAPQMLYEAFIRTASSMTTAVAGRRQQSRITQVRTTESPEVLHRGAEDQKSTVGAESEAL